ncbi:MAG: hypothetical protein ACRERV_18070 [Methylococcales bacterium]
MNTNIKNVVIEDLNRRKAVMRHYVRNLSPTEKIMHLELLQKRTYDLAESRQNNGKGAINDKLKIWRKAQDQTYEIGVRESFK